ncbi:WYL domain-containing protein [Paenibacillus filicis]|uniref:WYL domain-containing protein n=1 Tax=Paenibacillus filicis TaxID=669464 RepID=A0ABU9DIE8_9BACL
MNPFEKIFNYQVMSRLQESGTFTVTAHERAWLGTMLEHPSAEEAFSSDTLEKLRSLLQTDAPTPKGTHFVEKARSSQRQIYHPLLRVLRRLIATQSGLRLTCRTKHGLEFQQQSGFPYKLEYSMVKQEWYLIWYHTRHKTLMNTKLAHITAVSEQQIPADQSEPLMTAIAGRLEHKKRTALVEIVERYHKELSRILYAFSCFEKEVAYDEAQHRYTIRLQFMSDESEYVLSKLRFLGKRVRVIEGLYLQQRMAESASKALARYGVDVLEEEEVSGQAIG